MDADLARRLAQSVRAADPDRYFSTLFAPAPLRPHLFALYAFNHEVARIAETVREPMLGAIRLEWWRETVAQAAHGAPRNHDVARGLASLFAAHAVEPTSVEGIIAARVFDANAERFADFAALEAYVDATGGALMRAAATILGGDPDLARPAALAYGLTGLLRSLPFHNNRHKLYLPLDLLAALHLTPEEFFLLKDDPRIASAVRQTALRARDHFLAARRGARPRAALAAMLPAALVPVYLRRLSQMRDVSIHRRQMALLSATMKKRL
ncbi:MAG: squalene/phytoene synthase family protein [Alphaproteobacteria bacterium]|nr:squalene/phytoene synthase family protein [Alphaproteobacteria bacterium]